MPTSTLALPPAFAPALFDAPESTSRFESPGGTFDLKRIRNGDQAAARELVEQLYPMVFRIVRYHRPRQVAPEDLAQDVFLKVFARLDQYRCTVPLSHWVSRIAIRTCLDQIRFRKRRPELSRTDLSESELAVFDSTVSNDRFHSTDALAVRDLVGKLLDQLPPKDRLIIQLFDLQQLSALEIQQLTGMKPTVIKVRVYRARRRLRRLFTELQATEGHLPAA